MAELDVIILNYNRADLLRPCLQSVLNSVVSHTLRVWVVDNASTDGSAELVAREFPAVQLIRNPVNNGFAAGNNLALRAILAQAATTATTTPASRYVMLLNNDTVVEPDALQLLIDYLEAHPAVGAVGPKLLLLDGSLDLACRRSFPSPAVSFYRMTGLSRLFPHSPRFGRYNLTFLDPDLETEVDALVGAAMVVRLEVVREVGLLDESFFMYGEDLDWCFRIKAFGWRIVYYPRAVIHHHKRAASTRRALPSIRAFYDAMRIFHRKHYARQTSAPLNWLIEVGITLKEWWALTSNLVRPPARRQVG
ncbi:glycosyltransferase family 2 protein [Kallotenue papyrolyticum]|uniref:glycosyltransferase family 2 protein n=1 Tax=Kallotenue papyrolyticum TaxID=1325125 RepID=UPI000478652A|nr:glycosyltransferase family 2 protein [Kallotenue papyrolyticum]